MSQIGGVPFRPSSGYLGTFRPIWLRATETAARRWVVSLALLLLGYFVAGIFGRFPWKADEPHSFGMIWEILEENQWLVMQIADQPFVEKPPLVYWLGALCAKAFPFLAIHESARLAVPILVTISLFPLYVSARRLWPETVRWRASVQVAGHDASDQREDTITHASVYALLALALVAGTLGFSEQIHKLTADLGQLAGVVVALYGLVRLGAASECARGATVRSAVTAGFIVSIGVGIGFLSKGLLIPGVIALTCMLCLALPAYRTRATIVAALVAIAGVLPWLLIWPAALFRESPELFTEWFWTNNIGRFLGSVELGGNHVALTNKLGSLAVAAFPAVLLAGWVVFHSGSLVATRGNRSEWSAVRDAPGHVCIALYLVASLAVLFGSGSFRDNYLLPVLPAFVLLGLPALALPPNSFGRSLKAHVDRGFAVAATLVVLLWLGLVITGTVNLPWLASALGRILPLPFPLRVSVLSIAAAGSGLVLWGYVVRRDPCRSAVVSWCAGIAMLWSIGMTLLLPWIDAARSYREVFTDLATHVMAPNCLASWNLGESELAMLEYVTGLEATRMHLGHSGTGDPSRPNPLASGCDWVLVLSNRASGDLVPDRVVWTQVWNGSRPGDIGERFALYRRFVSDAPAGARTNRAFAGPRARV